LVSAHQEFQRETRDPFLDPTNREAYITEQRDYCDWRYKATPDFHWNHVANFREWREARNHPRCTGVVTQISTQIEWEL
jgi:hypothetical protein